jgi:hypothetical protein
MYLNCCTPTTLLGVLSFKNLYIQRITCMLALVNQMVPKEECTRWGIFHWSTKPIINLMILSAAQVYMLAIPLPD